MSTTPFEERYRTLLAERGVVLGGDDSYLAPLPETLPDALRAWYRVAGRSDLNAAHNRILDFLHLRDEGDMVVFAEENQKVVVWAFDRGTTTEDPEVWQGQVVDENLEWHAEGTSLSRFLIEMLDHTVFDDAHRPMDDPDGPART